jgi:putative sigma-54 modulation protein
MNVNISADGLHLTPSIENHVRAKMDRVLKHFDEIVTVRVILSIEKTENRAESQCASCNIHVKGADLFAKTSSQDLYATIDELMEKMDGLVRKHKGKAKSHRAPHAANHASQLANAA